MKNMGAALGRLGAMFATPVVTGMPVVFQAEVRLNPGPASPPCK